MANDSRGDNRKLEWLDRRLCQIAGVLTEVLYLDFDAESETSRLLLPHEHTAGTPVQIGEDMVRIVEFTLVQCRLLYSIRGTKFKAMAAMTPPLAVPDVDEEALRAYIETGGPKEVRLLSPQRGAPDVRVDEAPEDAIGTAVLAEVRKLAESVQNISGRLAQVESSGRPAANQRAPAIVPAPEGLLGRAAALAEAREMLDADGLLDDTNIVPRFKPHDRRPNPAPVGSGTQAQAPAQLPESATLALVSTLMETNAALLTELKELREGGLGHYDDSGGGGRGEARYVRLKENFLGDPEPEIAQYFATVRTELGAEEPGSPWTVENYGKEMVPFGSHTTLKRLFFILAKVVHFHRTNRPRHALGMATLGLQAVERAVRDDGSWAAAWPITYLPDPNKTQGAVAQAKMATIGKMLSERETVEQIIKKQKEGKGGAKGGSQPSAASG